MIFAFKRSAGIANLRFHLGFHSAFKRLAGVANSRFHVRFYSDTCLQALSWYSEFALLVLATLASFGPYGGVTL